MPNPTRSLLRLVLLASLTLATPVLMTGCEETVTPANYALLKAGMTQGEVETLLGGPGTKEDVSGVGISAAAVAGSNTSTFTRYVWKSGHKQISADIKDGKVISFGKSGF